MKDFKKNMIKRAGRNIVEIQPNPKIHVLLLIVSI